MTNILIQCGDHFENQKRVFLLARELKAVGCEPIILMYKKKNSSGNIFSVNKIKVFYLSDFFHKKPPTQQNLDFNSPILGINLKVLDFIEYEVKRRPRISWPSQIRKTSMDVFRYVEAINDIINTIKPSHIVIWNGFTGYVANILRVLSINKNIKHSFIERGLLKNSIFIDTQGVNGASFLAKIDSFIDVGVNIINHNFIKEYVYSIFPLLCYKKENRDILSPLYKNKRIIFFPLQVQLDTNIIMYSKYNTMREAFFEIYNHLNSKDTLFILRPHPEEDKNTPLNIPILDNVIVSTDKTLEYWIENCDLVVTINSTVGLESLLSGKPVICLGKSIYSSLKCLSTYNNFIKDERVILNEVINYLYFLLNNNLIIENNKFNNNVINNIFGVSSSSISSYHEDYLHITHSEVTIYFDFCSVLELDLTYRKNKEPITIDYIKSMLSMYFNIEKINFTKNKKEADVIITDKSYKDINFIDNVKYIDIYGVLLN